MEKENQVEEIWVPEGHIFKTGDDCLDAFPEEDAITLPNPIRYKDIADENKALRRRLMMAATKLSYEIWLTEKKFQKERLRDIQKILGYTDEHIRAEVEI